MADYKEFLDSINREAYHAGEYQWEEDGYTVTRTYHYSPPGCHSSCGLLYYVKDGKVEFVEGDPLDPCANGRLCMRCLNRVEAINHPDRLKYPMKRAGERGENKWERITWDEAYDIVERETRKVWEEYGPESILCTKGTARGTVWQLHYFFQAAFKTANVAHIGFTGYACYLPRTCGCIAPMGDFPIVDASQGHPDRYMADEFRPPEVLVVWGNEPLASNADGYIGHWLVQCVQMGSKIISIDPRLTWWGARAEYWLPVRPGTDAALACAWLNVIINEDLYDHEFVEKWTTGFDVIAEHVQEWTAERAAEICQIPVEDVIGSARLFASGNSSAIQWGLAFDQNMSAMALNLAAVDLMAICGNIDTPGGWLLVHNAYNVSRGSDNGVKWVDPEAAKKKATMHYVFNTDGEDFIHQAASEAVLHCMETGEPYPIKMWYAQSTNELACAAMDAPRLYKALKEDPVHRVRRSFHDAHRRGAGRRGHARGHELRAQLRPFMVDARAHAVEGDQLLRGQVRRRDHRGAGPSPEPRRLPVGNGRGLRELVPHAAVRPGVVRHQGIGEQRARPATVVARNSRSRATWRACRRPADMPTTSSTPRTASTRRACCAPTANRASRRRPAASSYRRSPSRCGASRRGRTSRSPRRVR